MGEGRFAATNCSVTRRRIIIPISHINNLFNPLYFFWGGGGETRKRGVRKWDSRSDGKFEKEGKMMV